MGLFDAISGIARAGADFVTDFAGGAFTAIEERARGGRLRTTGGADPGRRAGAGVANLFGDIAESLIKSQVPRQGPVQVGTNQRGVPVYSASIPSPLSGRGQATRVTAQGQQRTSASAASSLLGLGSFTTLAQPVQQPQIQQAGIGGALLDLLPGLPELLPAASGAITRVIGQAEQRFGIDIPLLGPGSMTDTGITGGLQVADVALPGGAPITSVSGRAALAPMATAGMRLPSQITFIAPTPSGGSRIVAYRNMGRPILWSGDLAAVRRVSRVRRRVGRSRPR